MPYRRSHWTLKPNAVMRPLVAAILIGLLASVNSPGLVRGQTDDSDPYNGYWWYGDWVPGLISFESWFTPAPYFSYGNAVFYAPNVMEGTARHRGFSLDGYLDGVAMLSPADIGRTVWLRRPGHEWEGPYLVVDCARRGDMYGTIVHRDEVVEVGFRTALRWGMVRETAGGGWRTNYWREENVEVLTVATLPDWATDSGLPKPRRIYYPRWWEQRIVFASFRTEPVHFPLNKGLGTWRWTDGRIIRWTDMYRQPWVDIEYHRPWGLPLLCREEGNRVVALCE